MSTNLNVDTTGNTFAGTINGRIKVYVDPYESLEDGSGQWYVAGYRGASAYDAGLFYCPYVPLQMVRAVGENDFHQRLRLKHVMEWLRIHLLVQQSQQTLMLMLCSFCETVLSQSTSEQHHVITLERGFIPSQIPPKYL